VQNGRAMKTWLSVGMFLLVVLVVCSARAQEPEPSLGDVARQSRAEKKADPNHVLSDENEAQPAPAPQDASLCGAPVPLVQDLYAAALAGQKTPAEDDLAKALLEWMNLHPQLEKMDPEELAKADEPRTDEQVQADQELANKIAQSFTDEMVEFKKNHTDEEVQERLAKLMSATAPQRQADVLESAVRDEKLRRTAAEGKAPAEEDRVKEAVNLYAICENKRLIASQGEVDKMTKAALRAKLTEAGFAVSEPGPIGNR
jgi:hypothetical protein